ncbi:alpha/beta hydrolase family protein [Polyangium jinanense]|uniref:Prolyl oligopeptidase family serine peptidase n=1 Tax=Polyangium jinanense TaxID=2829994 RepID=A0A9X3X8U5_9BACT|nr:prolyl oligopeptidase family serine peptidase [Polyangium jinanense]MDC3960900.1 prolyl oligopeptidase family serine peptidase [Polyangium jinanense]MDC3984493.1 prolyl oligopeptidase family serine peptidase [Polyangium jinanense]
MKHLHCLVLLLALTNLAGCGGQEQQSVKYISEYTVDYQPEQSLSLSEARYGFRTKLTQYKSYGEPAPEPPPGVFRKIRYDAPAGKLAAYISPDPQDGKKHPAIIWVVGGLDYNSIGNLWTELPDDADQNASDYRRAGIIMMFPSQRGGNDNPGFKEAFFGEVDDIIAAADHLAKQEYVDPNRIYLGGHSCGGALVLLVAESTARFRAVFSFGPIDDITRWGPGIILFDTSDPREAELRAPIRWLHSIQSPVFVLEGTAGGNVRALHAMARASRNDNVHFYAVEGADHGSILEPTNALIAKKILRDVGPTTNLTFDEEELNRPFAE